jgi:glycosyltransferase involved in cell wall biosynthesis
VRASIVIPCYRQADLLAECLDSILAQSVSQWEAIVVDDASPDGEQIRDVVERYADGRIRLARHDRNRGLAAARNTGIRAALASLVVGVDSDDRLDGSFLERLLPLLELDPELDCVFSDLLRFGAHDDVYRYGAGRRLDPLRGFCPPGAGTLMRKAFWVRVGGYDEAEILRLGLEDREFYIRASTHGFRAAHVPEPLYHYRSAADSMRIRAHDHHPRLRRYIYHKHRAAFKRAGEGRRFLAAGFEKAARASALRGMRVRAFALSLRAFLLRPSPGRLKNAVRRLAVQPHRCSAPFA